MSKLNKNSKRIIAGSILGGIIGIGAISLYYASRRANKNSPMNMINSALSQISDVLESGKDNAHCAMKDVEDKIIENEDVITDLFELASVGISLWKKIKQGK